MRVVNTNNYAAAALFGAPESTIMDKSPWESQNVTSILCVSQVLSQKAVLSFYKSMSPPPSPPKTLLKDQRNCALTVSTPSCGVGGRG